MGAAAPDLPPQGDARRDELKRRLDALNAEAERLSSELESEGIDPAKFRIDPEVAGNAFDDDLAGFTAQSDYRYAWMYRDPFNKFGNRVVFSARREGWEPVKTSMPEGKAWDGMVGPCGELFNADCILMRIRLDRYFVNDKKNRAQRRARELGVSAQLVELAEKNGVNVHVGLPAHIRSQIEAVSQAHMQDRAARRRVPIRGTDAQFRTGHVPGLRAPGGRN